jgi:hypothetical protein
VSVNTFSYQEALQRIHAEFIEMPGMQLTPAQVERLAGVDKTICKRVLDDLVRAGFLRMSTNGIYVKSSGISTSADVTTYRS